MLGAAAQAVEPGDSTRRELAGLLTAAPYAGETDDSTDAAYGPDGALALADRDGRVSMWNVADPRRPVRISSRAAPTIAMRVRAFWLTRPVCGRTAISTSCWQSA